MMSNPARTASTDGELECNSVFDWLFTGKTMAQSNWETTKRAREGNPSPPRPELDLEEAHEAATHQLDEALLTAVNLGVTGHVGLEQARSVVELGDDAHGGLPARIVGRGGDGRDGGDRALEAALRIRLRLEDDLLADGHIGDLLFRHGDLDGDGFHLVNFGNEVALLHGLADLVLELVRGDDAGNGTDDFEEAELFFEVMLLRLQPVDLGRGGFDLLLAAAGEENLQLVGGFLDFLLAHGDLFLGILEVAFGDE